MPSLKIASPTAMFSQSRPVGGCVRELRHHLAVMQHRPGDQVGKQVTNKVWWTKLNSLASPRQASTRKAIWGEGEEGDPQRKHDGVEMPVPSNTTRALSAKKLKYP